jgi:hypothetical protein
MKVRDVIDFSKIEWEKVDEEKAKFIYGEAVGRLASIHKNIDGITGKALGMLSFSLPVLTALTGFFVLQWGEISVPLVAATVCSVVLLSAIMVLLLLILLPRGVNSARGEPGAYFTDGYYLRGMADILKGNIQTLHRYIIDDGAVLYWRGSLFRAAVALFAAFPLLVSVAWVAASVLR